MSSLHADELAVETMANGWSLLSGTGDLLRNPAAQGEGSYPISRLAELSERICNRPALCFKLLCWTDPGRLPTELPNPSVLELDNKLECKGGDEGVFASPCSEAVRVYDKQVVISSLSKYPKTKLLILDCRMAKYTMLGYSEPTRLASISALHLDPIDLHVGFPSSNVVQDQYDREWAKWREQQVTSLIADIVKSARAVNHKVRIQAIVHPTIYTWVEPQRYYPAQDWQEWVRKGLVDEVLFDDVWSIQQAGWIYAYAAKQAKSANPQVICRPVIRIGESAPSAERLGLVWDILRAQGASDPVLYVQSPAELDIVADNLALFEDKSGHTSTGISAERNP